MNCAHVFGFALVAALLAACPSPPAPVPPIPDAADGASPAPTPSPTPPPVPPAPGSCADACANLARLGCAQGLPASCPAALAVIDSSATTSHPLLVHGDAGAPTRCADLAAASSQAAVLALGSSCTPADAGP